jgi:hypothetical protein
MADGTVPVVMDEDAWRAAAVAVLAVLRELVPEPTEADGLAAGITHALGLPAGQARAALRTALTAHPRTREYLRRLCKSEYLRGVDGAARRNRYLDVDAPATAEVGRRVNVFVRVLLNPPGDGAALRPFPVPEAGARLTVTLSTAGLVPLDGVTRELTVPSGADSDPVYFGLSSVNAGVHRVTVRVFLRGAFLGECVRLVAVGQVAPPPDTSSAGPVELELVAEPGEFTLQIARVADRYTFQFIGPTWYRPELTPTLLVDPSSYCDALIKEVTGVAVGAGGWSPGPVADRRIASLGARLWLELVPEPVRRQFWEWSEQITALTVLGDLDEVPWELLYATDPGHEPFFLADRYPVLRRVPGQGRSRTLRMSRAVYVVPPDPPAEAATEIELVRAHLGATVADLGVLADLGTLTGYLDCGGFDVLHVASHCGRSAGGEAQIAMADGTFQPSDLSLAVGGRTLRASAPLVFLNACTTARQSPRLTTLSNWAAEFLKAGAGAFLGTLWSVPTETARDFADAFYQSFVDGKQPLGEASRTARQAVQAAGPAWLGYTVYGAPATHAVRPEPVVPNAPGSVR